MEASRVKLLGTPPKIARRREVVLCLVHSREWTLFCLEFWILRGMQNMKKKKISITGVTFITLVLAASSIFGLMRGHSAEAKTGFNSSTAPTTSAVGLAAQDSGVVLPKTAIYALNADNTIYVLPPGATSFSRLARVTGVNGNLIGIDFRVADGQLYALTDTGSIYTISLSSTNLGAATLVSNLSPRFAGGFQSLFDFNPVLNAIRAIGSND